MKKCVYNVGNVPYLTDRGTPTSSVYFSEDKQIIAPKSVKIQRSNPRPRGKYGRGCARPSSAPFHGRAGRTIY